MGMRDQGNRVLLTTPRYRSFVESRPRQSHQRPRETTAMFDVATTDNVKSTTDPHRPKDFLDPTEIKSFLKAAKAGRNGIRDHLLFLMMYRHGLRCSEAVDLRIEDVSFDRAVGSTAQGIKLRNASNRRR
jgi:integrase